MIIRRKMVKDSITPIELDIGESLEFTLKNGNVRKIKLIDTGADIIRTTLKELKTEEKGGRTDIRFFCNIEIDGVKYFLEREISTQKSFYKPWVISGLRIFFDAVASVFDYVNETHGDCKPRKAARFAIQDEGLRVFPELVHPFCPLHKDGLKIEECFRGEDCWMGAYNGVSAHGGLDINHKSGTPLYVPFDLDDHFYFNSLEMGDNNNRWRGIRKLTNGQEWIIQAHHMTRITVPERTPLKRGTHFADAAGVWVGLHEHSHFVLKIHDDGDTYLLDPWILFWQMYEDKCSFENSFY